MQSSTVLLEAPDTQRVHVPVPLNLQFTAMLADFISNSTVHWFSSIHFIFSDVTRQSRAMYIILYCSYFT